jgi:hypothetical protein
VVAALPQPQEQLQDRHVVRDALVLRNELYRRGRRSFSIMDYNSNKICPLPTSFPLQMDTCLLNPTSRGRRLEARAKCLPHTVLKRVFVRLCRAE